MSTDNSTLMRAARELLRDKWGLAIGTFLIYMIITGLPGWINPRLNIIMLIIGGPLSLGAAIFSLNIARGTEARLEQIFQGFNNFTTALVAYLLMILYVVLWSLLLIIPGIIAALGYALIFYIIADEPDIKPQDALRKSKAMMDGYKLKLFYLGLQFFLLALLCILTLGIGFLFLIPFVNVTMARFYDDVRSNSATTVNAV